MRNNHIVEMLVTPQEIEKELEWIDTQQYKQANDYLSLYQAIDAAIPYQ